MNPRKRKLLHQLALAPLWLAALAASSACSTRPAPAEGPIVSLGALGADSGGAAAWPLGAGDALGAEIFACYVALLEDPDGPMGPHERYARDAEVVLPDRP